MKSSLTIILLLFALNVAAQEIYAILPSSPSLGLRNEYHSNWVGLRYHYSFATATPQKTADKTPNRHYRYSGELTAKINLIQKLSVFISVPYIGIEQKNASLLNASLQDIGDASAMLLFSVFKKPDINVDEPIHELLVGSGIKVPTGRWRSVNTDNFNNYNMQLGSGSLDIPFLIMYKLRDGNQGMQVEATYRINTANVHGYRFGNPLAVRYNLFRQFTGTSHLLTPAFGLYMEHWGNNTLPMRNNVLNTAGLNYGINAATDYSIKNFTFGGNAQLPLHSYMARGVIHQKLFYSLHTLFNF